MKKAVLSREHAIAIDKGLALMQKIVGQDFKLTLVARYIGTPPLDADLMWTLDDTVLVIDVIRRLRDRDPLINAGDKV